MPKILQVAQLGSPALRKTASPISDFGSADLKELIDDLLATLKDTDGVGISAPQVYVSKRLFIIESKPSDRYPDAPKMRPLTIINPKIIKCSDKIVLDYEGCSSIPGIRAKVPRYASIKTEYATIDGKTKTKTFKDFVARIFQHEIDHLDGLVFLDRLQSTRDIITDKEYKKMVAKQKKK